MNNKPNAQAKMIAAHLNAGNTITALEALQKFGCLRLAARIADLRNEGFKIVTSYMDRNGKRYAASASMQAIHGRTAMPACWSE